MDLFKDIKVEVISNNKSLPLYNPTDASEADDAYAGRKFVEAVTGAEFKVRVIVSKSIDLDSCKAIRVSISYDGGVFESFIVRTANLRKTFIRGYDFVGEHHSLITFCEQSNQWKEGNLSFGALQTKEIMDESFSPADINRLGSITIRFERVNLVKKRSSCMKKSSHHSISEIPEKALKGKAIANVILPVNETTIDSPIYSRYQSVTIPGEYGRTFTFTILYRSRQILQMLGYIPRSPSPATIDRKANIQQLRTQLALLEQEEHVKPERSETVHETKREHANLETLDTIPRVKRELDVPDKSESACKRTQHSRSVETIDLTDD